MPCLDSGLHPTDAYDEWPEKIEIDYREEKSVPYIIHGRGFCFHTVAAVATAASDSNDLR
jgi:hypothetical protein